MENSNLEMRMAAILHFADENHLYPEIPIIIGSGSNPIVMVKGLDGEFLTFSSNNYLGVAMNDSVIGVIDKYLVTNGIGACATPVLGKLKIYDYLEKDLAKFTGYPSAMTFSSASLASLGCIRAIVDAFPYYRQPKMGESVILGDELNHASIVDAARLAKSKYVIYRHNDMADLAHKLEKFHDHGILIVTDGVFSMDGDLANLPDIVRLAEMYNATVMVDDSHGFGILGPHGEGTPHHFGVKVDILLSSFTKAVGSSGGFIAASETIIQYLRVVARTGIFSDPLLPAYAAGICKTLEIFNSQEGGNLRQLAHANARYLRKALRELGFTIVGDETPIVPLIISDERKTVEFSKRLKEKRILAAAIRAPAVPHGKERLRFSVMATHTHEQLDRLINACALTGKELEII